MIRQSKKLRCPVCKESVSALPCAAIDTKQGWMPHWSLGVHKSASRKHGLICEASGRIVTTEQQTFFGEEEVLCVA